MPDPWLHRPPHFRMAFTPSRGEELQSEYLLPREHTLPAIEALRPLAALMPPVLQVSERRNGASASPAGVHRPKPPYPRMADFRA